MEVPKRLFNQLLKPLLIQRVVFPRSRRAARYSKRGGLVASWMLLLAALLVMAFPLKAAAQSLLPSSSGTGTSTSSAAQAQDAPIHMDALVLIDVTGDMSVDDVAAAFAAGRGRVYVLDQIMPTDDGRAVWYQLKLPHADTQRSMVMTVPHPGLDTADLYLPTPAVDPLESTVTSAVKKVDTAWLIQRSGDKVPVAQWPVRNLYPAFELVLGPSEPAVAYLRVTNVYAVSVNWTLRTGDGFRNHMKNWYLLLGIYVGLAILVVAVGLIQGAIWQEPICYLYAAYVAVVAATQLAITGLSGEYFWPTLGWWNDRSLSTLALGCSVLLLVFFHRLIAQRDVPRLSGWLVLMALAGAVLMAGSLAPNRVPFLKMFGFYYVLALATYLFVAGWYIARRPRVGLWIFAGMVCLSAGAAAPVMRLLGLAPTTIATQFGAQGGAALQIPLLMAGLYFRNREKRANQVRVGALTHVDPLTGATNHRVLLHRLSRLLERQRRSPNEGAVIRIRISNILVIRSEHGLEVMQTAVVHAGALVTSMAREGDTVGRHREGDFVWILQGEVTRSRLAEMAQTLIARGLGETPGLPPGVTLQFKLAVDDAPFKPFEAVPLLQALGAVLAEQSKRSGTGLKFLDRADVVSREFAA